MCGTRGKKWRRQLNRLDIESLRNKIGIIINQQLIITRYLISENLRQYKQKLRLSLSLYTLRPLLNESIISIRSVSWTRRYLTRILGIPLSRALSIVYLLLSPHSRTNSSYSSSLPPRCPCPRSQHKMQTDNPFIISNNFIHFSLEFRHNFNE